MPHLPRYVPITLLLAALALALPAGPARAAGGLSHDIVQRLRAGGHVIYFRHGVAQYGARPEAAAQLPDRYGDCREPERPLSAAGMTQMRGVGRAFAALGIPVGEALSSPYCRCIESLWYAFGRATVATGLTGLLGRSGEPAAQRRVRALKALLRSPPAAGRNRVLSAHRSNLRAAAGLRLAQGDAAVFRPGGPEGFRLVTIVPAAAWSAAAAGE